MELMNIVYLYLSFLLVVFLHELGHIPKTIKWYRFWIFPYKAAAMQGTYRLGGLIVNVALFSLIFYYKPENLLLQYAGLISWVHFMLYAIVGSLVPEPGEWEVDIKKYVFDDVDNGYKFYFIGSAILAFIIMQSYYLNIFRGIFT